MQQLINAKEAEIGKPASPTAKDSAARDSGQKAAAKAKPAKTSAGAGVASRLQSGRWTASRRIRTEKP